MPEISLTDLVDFVAKSGTPRLTHVRKIKARGDYSPAEDFWRRLRLNIVEHHSTGQPNRDSLDETLENLADPKKRRNYEAAIRSYKSFLGRKRIQWFQPNSTRWSAGGLTVRINPELGLVINGARHHIKLYFKADPISKSKADMILLLMEQNLINKQTNDHFCLLDVQRGKMFSSTSPDASVMPLLVGEATAFAAIWDHL